MRFAATVAYDGTAYHGFQRLTKLQSIQHELEAALAVIAGKPIVITGAGRTDAGVHAIGQVIAFDLVWHHHSDDLRNALNANLPADIAILEAHPVSSSFHPRYDAVSRTYRYSVYCAPVRDPLRRHSAWQVPAALNREQMAAAANYLKGTHDFSSFGTPTRGESTVRTVFDADWQTGRDDEYYFLIQANAFLTRMVRTVVGGLVRVGQDRMTVNEFQGILAACQRKLGPPPAPACGLTLIKVSYSD